MWIDYEDNMPLEVSGGNGGSLGYYFVFYKNDIILKGNIFYVSSMYNKS